MDFASSDNHVFCARCSYVYVIFCIKCDTSVRRPKTHRVENRRQFSKSKITTDSRNVYVCHSCENDSDFRVRKSAPVFDPVCSCITGFSLQLQMCSCQWIFAMENRSVIFSSKRSTKQRRIREVAKGALPPVPFLTFLSLSLSPLEVGFYKPARGSGGAL